MTVTRLISWNIQALRGCGPDRLGRLCALLESESPDIVMLQEVGVGSLPERLSEHLSTIGLKHRVFSGTDSAEKCYGNVVASRWPCILESPDWVQEAPWPQLLAATTVKAPAGDIGVTVAHIPNGSGNGWRKIDTFRALATGLGGPSEGPRILCGDFNEPRAVLASGQVIPFRGVEKNGVMTWEGNRGGRPRAAWRDGVLSVLGPNAGHGLRHVWFDKHGFETVTTHVTRANNRFFDHILVSEHFNVLDAGYHHDGWRAKGVSDHSAAWAEIALR